MVVPITAKSPDAHMACCRALTEGERSALTAGLLDVRLVMACRPFDIGRRLIAPAFVLFRAPDPAPRIPDPAPRIPVLRLQRRSDPGKVVIAVPDRVVLEYELARERGIGVERIRLAP